MRNDRNTNEPSDREKLMQELIDAGERDAFEAVHDMRCLATAAEALMIQERDDTYHRARGMNEGQPVEALELMVRLCVERGQRLYDRVEQPSCILVGNAEVARDFLSRLPTSEAERLVETRKVAGGAVAGQQTGR